MKHWSIIILVLAFFLCIISWQAQAGEYMKIGSDLRVTSDASLSDYPSLSWSGSEFGVSWHDSRDENNEIYFARIGGVCP